MLLNKASPKTISRRTSYIRVRLEFLRYPQVIPRLFNAYEFGPPLDFTQASACSWIGHPVSGLFHMTFSPFSDLSHLNVLYLLVNIGFQVLFHSPPGVLFTFPSRYCFSIGHQVVFSLMGWSPLLHTRFHVPRITPDSTMSLDFSLTRLSLSSVCFPKHFC